jgi:hypothetical protein
MNKDASKLLLTAGLFGLMATALGYMVFDKIKQSDAKNSAIMALSTEIATLKKKADRAEAETKRLQELKAAVKEYVKILPAREVATDAQVIKMCEDYKNRSGISIDTFLRQRVQAASPSKNRRGGAAPADKAKGKKKGSDFEKVILGFKISGNFEQFVKFLNFIERHESFLQVTSFALTPMSNLETSAKLAVDLQISTFRYNAPVK